MKNLIFIFLINFMGLSISFSQNIDEIDMQKFKPNKKMRKEIDLAACDKLFQYLKGLGDEFVTKNDTINDSFIIEKIKKGEEDVYSLDLPHYYNLCYYKTMIPEIIKLLKNKTETDVVGWVIPVERARAGLLCEACGDGLRPYMDIITYDDINKVAGRANYLLKKFTGKNFGNVKLYATDNELDILQKKWIKWVKKRCK